VSHPVVPLLFNIHGPAVKDLHASLGKLGFELPKTELDAQTLGTGSQDAVRTLQARYALPTTGLLDDATKAAVTIAIAGADTDKFRVEGRLFLDHGLPATGLVVRFYNRVFGGTDVPLGETKTDAQVSTPFPTMRAVKR